MGYGLAILCPNPTLLKFDNPYQNIKFMISPTKTRLQVDYIWGITRETLTTKNIGHKNLQVVLLACFYSKYDDKALK